MAPIATSMRTPVTTPRPTGAPRAAGRAFALRVLGEAYPDQTIDAANTRIIAVGVFQRRRRGAARGRTCPATGSTAVVAVSPNVFAATEGARSTTTPPRRRCLHLCTRRARVRRGGVGAPGRQARARRRRTLCFAAGRPACCRPQRSRRRRRRARAPEGQGWSDGAIAAAALSTGFDLFRAVAVTYASTYTRSGRARCPAATRSASSAPTARRARPRPPSARVVERRLRHPAGRRHRNRRWHRDGVEVRGRRADPRSRAACLARRCGMREADGQELLRGVPPRAPRCRARLAGAGHAWLPTMAWCGKPSARRVCRRDQAAGATCATGACQTRSTSMPSSVPPLAARYVPMLPYRLRRARPPGRTLVDGAAPARVRRIGVPRARRQAGVAP
jgi:hypothetical protein